VKYKTAERQQFVDALDQKLRTIPGATGVSIASGLPPLRRINANDTEVEGYQQTPDSPAQNVYYWNVVGNDYFKTMKIRLLEGRTFERQDENPNSMPVVIVNQALAKRFWTGSPLGRRVNPGFGDPKVWCTIVGVVEDTKNAGMDKPAGPELYFQVRQAAEQFLGSNVSFVVRGANDSTALEGSIRNTVRELDPSLPVYNLWSMDELVSKSMVQPRFLALLLATFSAIALFLAAIGIYGVMAYSVAQRTQEIGVRMALGARPLHVLRLVLKQSVVMLLIGTVIGLIGAFALTRLMRTLLFEITATDPLTYVSVIGILSVVALLACYIPARRAAKVDPLIALRYE
ncbi:MAG TPA: FtsX-like permease family protein, partial [Pyrinomonadaceae bacterium]|nr:FtsX-like permease family protein [Pyrinomonadaceae bacterium]